MRELITLAILGLCMAGACYSILAWQRVRHAQPKTAPYTGDFSVFQTPYASLGPVPNGALGVLLYAFVAAVVTLAPGLWLLATTAVALSVAYGLYLIYILRQILHKHCRICYTAHAINFAMLLLLLAR